MLGKQGCKFMSNLEAMVMRIVKAKYFPRGEHFLDAIIGHNLSYARCSTWSS